MFQFSGDTLSALYGMDICKQHLPSYLLFGLLYHLPVAQYQQLNAFNSFNNVHHLSRLVFSTISSSTRGEITRQKLTWCFSVGAGVVICFTYFFSPVYTHIHTGRLLFSDVPPDNSYHFELFNSNIEL